MHPYNSEQFATLYATQVGQQLWQFLNSEAIATRLEVASELSKPAVEGIEEQLLEAFGPTIMEHRVKQMIGHMVRQILERRGWVVDQSEVKVQSVPFVKATRYKRPNRKSFHAYRNAANPRDVVITATRQHSALPPGKWTYYVTFSSPLQAQIGFGIDLQTLIEQVTQNGYHRVQVPRLMRAA
jgi:hypothetical protein